MASAARKGSSMGAMNVRPCRLIDRQPHSRRIPGRRSRAPGCPGKVGGAQKARLLVQELEDLLLVPDVVAGGDHVHARLEELGHLRRRDAEPARRVLAVGDDDVRLHVGLHEPQQLLEHPPPRRPDHVRDEENPHECRWFRMMMPDREGCSAPAAARPPPRPCPANRAGREKPHATRSCHPAPTRAKLLPHADPSPEVGGGVDRRCEERAKRRSGRGPPVAQRREARAPAPRGRIHPPTLARDPVPKISRIDIHRPAGRQAKCPRPRKTEARAPAPRCSRQGFPSPSSRLAIAA